MTVIAHELGHILLGKGHYNIPGQQTLMQDNYGGGTRFFRRLHNCEVKIIKSYYSIPFYNVYLANRTLDNQDLGDQIKIIGKGIYPSNSTVSLLEGIYDFETNIERKFLSSWLYKHNNWNLNRLKFYLKNSDSIKNNKDMIAYFDKLFYAIIKTQLESYFIPDKGSFKFQDPWYVKEDGTQPGNYWIIANGTYEPTGKEGASEKGVFLNQEIASNKPYYSVKADAVQDIYLSHTGKMHKFYFQNWSASPQGSADFQNANSLETPVVFKQEGAVVSANYKGSLLSNNVNAISNTSQRKVIRTSNGDLHLFYVSMGKIWYEKSVNNGTSWYAPKIINGAEEVKSFSVDDWNNKIYIASHLKEGSENGILIDMIDENGNVSNVYVFSTENDVDSKPVIGAYNNNVFVVYKLNNSEPLKFLRLQFDGVSWRIYESEVENSTNLSINPSLSLVKSTNNYAPMQDFGHLLWEERSSDISSELCYIRFGYTSNLTENYFSNFDVITKGSGYELCTNGNIVAVNAELAHIGFLGQRKFYPVENNYIPDESRAVFTSLANKGIFYSFGDDVQSVSLNRCNTRWTFAWTRGNDLPVQYVDSRDIKTIYQLGNLRGVDVYVTNGIVPEDMFAFSINTSVSPYPINFRAIYGELIPEELVVTEDSREGVVSKEGADVYYSIGDIKVGDQKVEFYEVPDTVGMITLENANRYLISKPFMVNDNSGFVYTIKYGVTDSSALKEALTNTDYIKFRVELIDYNTKEILGLFDEVTYNSENVSKYENINYYVNTEGLGERMVQLRLVIINNIDPYYSLSDKFSDAAYNLQKKRAMKQISYRGMLGEKVYSYELIQNYPNPFNPVTKIRYSVKETKPVMIKLYDIVGREVATIINEVKDAGEYEVELDAGRLGLSSGVYFYQMKAGEFTSIKKMVVLK